MPVTPTYPGVYVEEIPSGVRTIVGVPTSVTAFIGRSSRGEVNQAKTINSFGDFEREYGGLWVDSQLGFAVKDFYLNGGSRAVIVRLFHPYFEDDTARNAAQAAAQSVIDAVAAAAAPASGAANDVLAAATTAAGDPAATPTTVATAARAAVPASADEPQASAADAAATLAETAAALGDATPTSVTDAITAGLGSAIAAGMAAVASAIAADPANATEPRTTAANTIAEAAAAAANAADASAATVEAAVNDALGEAAPLTKAQLTVNGLALEAANEGAWGSQLRGRIDHDVKAETPAAASVLFNLTIRDGVTGNLEVFRNVSVETDHPRNVELVLKNGSSLVKTRGTPTPGSRPAAHADPQPGVDIWADNTPATSTGVAPAGQSSDGSALVTGDFNGSGTQANKRGLYALERTDIFNLLCIPPYQTNGNIDPALIADVVTYCQQKRALFIVDPLQEWMNKEQAIGDGTSTGIAALGTNSSHAALFFPRLRQPNPLKDNQIEDFAPCGAIAGIFARTDNQRGVWKAPAGLEATLNGVAGLTVQLSDLENGELNPLGINCLRTFPAAGRVVWGARTMAGDDRLASEWKYIPVRRLALYIQESLFRGLQWVVFEPNDEPLWAQIRLNVGAFMQNLFRQGAFQGSTPREAYLVKCDSETTTQNDINLGIVNIVVGFAPLKPAEFVILKIQQLAGQIEV